MPVPSVVSTELGQGEALCRALCGICTDEPSDQPLSQTTLLVWPVSSSI